MEIGTYELRKENAITGGEGNKATPKCMHF